MTRRVLKGAIAALAGLVVLTGCTQTVEGTAAKSGSGAVSYTHLTLPTILLV